MRGEQQPDDAAVGEAVKDRLFQAEIPDEFVHVLRHIFIMQFLHLLAFAVVARIGKIDREAFGKLLRGTAEDLVIHAVAMCHDQRMPAAEGFVIQVDAVDFQIHVGTSVF